MEKLLPQANNIETIVDSFIFIATCKKYTAGGHAEFCHFDPRQSAYYTNACYYLGLIDDKKQLTEIGKQIFESKKIKQGVYEKIFTDKLFNAIYAKRAFEGENEAKNFAFKLLKSEYPTYGDEVIKRRTSSIMNWCEQIDKYLINH